MGRDGYASSTELIDLHDQGMIGNVDSSRVAVRLAPLCTAARSPGQRFASRLQVNGVEHLALPAQGCNAAGALTSDYGS
jgi:hypothetical protein